jgi:hypothetical protein
MTEEEKKQQEHVDALAKIGVPSDVIERCMNFLDDVAQASNEERPKD